ncbi:hypothetical protein [Sorangium sp. So ce1182]|uniref:hypothetical protein n=1 Tax=Sorangium sp. So ce1182 TaxID=3133334 RepID=UPI003F5E4710
MNKVEHLGRRLALGCRRSEQPPDRFVRDARGLDIACRNSRRQPLPELHKQRRLTDAALTPAPLRPALPLPHSPDRIATRPL